MTRILTMAILLFFSGQAWAKTNAIFLNPGAEKELFWSNVNSIMHASAKAHSLELTTKYSNRNRVLMLNQVVEIANQPTLPDYLILVNDNDVAKKALQSFYQKPVYIVFFINDMDATTRIQLLTDPHWKEYLLPAIIEDNYQIGRDSAASLAPFFKTKPAHVVAVTGDNIRETSLERNEGMEGYFNLHLDIVLEQIVYADWQFNKAFEQTKIIINRFPGVDGIWTGNDQMAAGVVQALKESHRKPGEEIKISTINPSIYSYELLKKGEVNSVGGGSFLLGGVVGLNIAEHQENSQFNLCLARKFYRQLSIDSPLFQMIFEQNWQALYQQEVFEVCQSSPN